MDRIGLHNIHAYGRHGANSGERDTPQQFDVDVTLDIDLVPAEATDDLGDTLDYATLHKTIVTTVASTSYDLLERLAGDIVHAIFVDPRVARAEVRVAKPLLLDGATPSITLARENPRYRRSFP